MITQSKTDSHEPMLPLWERFHHERSVSFPLTIVKDHLIVDGTLIDTGFPISFACPGMLDSFLNARVDYLAGCDTLANRTLLVDWPGRVVTLERSYITGESQLRARRSRSSLRIESSILGCPVIEASIGGQSPVRAVFDTGAWLSYVDPQDVVGLVPIRTETDFHHSVGVFETPVYRIAVSTTLDRIIEADCGILPMSMQWALKAVGITRIIGSALIRDRCTLLDLRGGTLSDVR